MGYGSDGILSAKMITAKGELITISGDENSELLYAIKGAGQFFGIITSLTVKMHELSVLGTPNNTVWAATLLFPTQKATELAKALLALKSTPRNYTLAGIMAAPPTFDPIIMVIAVHMGTKEHGEKSFKEVLDLGPVATLASGEIPYANINDAFVAFETKGGLKNWLAPGLTDASQFKPEYMSYYVEQHAKIAKEFPSANATVLAIEFTSSSKFDEVQPGNESAFAHHDVALFS